MPREITVLGLGYIGLPTAAMFATHGHTVCGYDVNSRVIDTLRRGEIHIEEPGLLAFVRAALHSGRLVPADALRRADAYIICVPTPFHSDTKRADLSYVESAAKALVPLLKPGDLVILESTVPARTTEDVLVPILETSGLSARRDLLVAHCPETVLPGNMIHELAHNHRVVGGLTPEATRAAAELYGSFVKADILLTDSTTAEFVKLIENTYRDVNIALANEIALVARDLGVSAREAIRIANQHPRVRIHAPGPGVGGHCIPVDPWFLVQASPRTRLIRTAREVNDAMPDHVASLAARLLASLREPKIALLGLAYKGNVDDTRESPSFEIERRLSERLPGARVVATDPHVRPERARVSPLGDALEGADCIVIATDHDAYRAIDPSVAAKLVRSRNVVDARGVIDARAWDAVGFRVETL